MKTEVKDMVRKCGSAGLALIGGVALVIGCSGAVPFSVRQSTAHSYESVLRTHIAIDVAGLALSVSIVIGKEDQ
ncbi:hypothetical protein [Sphingomonas sp.]|uniref:hypothetical protein n=1 Tax=Sphingomonas sp. TaxID=28214 RepID=UPI00333E60E0